MNIYQRALTAMYVAVMAFAGCIGTDSRPNYRVYLERQVVDSNDVALTFHLITPENGRIYPPEWAELSIDALTRGLSHNRFQSDFYDITEHLDPNVVTVSDLKPVRVIRTESEFQATFLFDRYLPADRRYIASALFDVNGVVKQYRGLEIPSGYYERRLEKFKREQDKAKLKSQQAKLRR